LLAQHGIASLPTRFSYTVRYGDGLYAHDFDSPLKAELQPEIERFQGLMRQMKRFSSLTESSSRWKAALNPYNYVPMGRLLDEHGREERFDEVILACNANQALMMLDRPSARERFVLGSVRYESELHNHAVVHWDASVLGRDATRPLETRSNYVEQYGARP